MAREISYADAGLFLDRFVAAWVDLDGELLVSLFSPYAEYHRDPFEPPLVGHNALRADLLDAAERETQREFEVQRHWVSGPTILAEWHASFVEGTSRDRVRVAGFSTFEMEDGRCVRHRQWWHRRRSR